MPEKSQFEDLLKASITLTQEEKEQIKKKFPSLPAKAQERVLYLLKNEKSLTLAMFNKLNTK